MASVELRRIRRGRADEMDKGRWDRSFVSARRLLKPAGTRLCNANRAKPVAIDAALPSELGLEGVRGGVAGG